MKKLEIILLKENCYSYYQTHFRYYVLKIYKYNHIGIYFIINVSLRVTIKAHQINLINVRVLTLSFTVYSFIKYLGKKK